MTRNVIKLTAEQKKNRKRALKAWVTIRANNAAKKLVQSNAGKKAAATRKRNAKA